MFFKKLDNTLTAMAEVSRGFADLVRMNEAANRKIKELTDRVKELEERLDTQDGITAITLNHLFPLTQKGLENFTSVYATVLYSELSPVEQHHFRRLVEKVLKRNYEVGLILSRVGADSPVVGLIDILKSKSVEDRLEDII